MCNKRKLYSKERGFTLVEVLVALIIFSLCAVVLQSQSSRSLNSQHTLIEKELALWVAKNRLVELNISEEIPADSTKTSEVNMAGLSWHLNTQFSPTKDSELIKVTVLVDRTPQIQAPLLALTTFMGMPADEGVP